MPAWRNTRVSDMRMSNTAQTVLTQKKGGGAAKRLGQLHTLFVGRMTLGKAK